MTKREYYRHCLSVANRDPDWLSRVIDGGADASPGMRPIHFALARLALRTTTKSKRGRKR